MMTFCDKRCEDVKFFFFINNKKILQILNFIKFSSSAYRATTGNELGIFGF